MDNLEIHENLIEITKYEISGKLPDPFRFDDGRRVKTVADWESRREEIYKTAVELQYGTIPPAPEFLEVEPLYIDGENSLNTYRIVTGTRENPVVFNMIAFKAKDSKNAPTVLSGDLCFSYAYNKEYVHTFLDNGINFVTFNRTELAPDIAGYNLSALKAEDNYEYRQGRAVLDVLETYNCTGQLKKAYPTYTFGAVGAWAWGYSRCVDAMEKLGSFGLDILAFTGHSRGGKTAAPAGALDKRATIVNPNESCSGGCGSYRIQIEAKTEDGTIAKSEPLSNIFRHFPSWLSADMKEYIGREEELPFDSHYLKALVAPRVLFVSEAASDIMANPVGSWQTSEAAREVYKLLGCEENLLWYFRRGGHGQRIEDISQLVNVIKHLQSGEPLNDKYFKLPFKPMELAFDWRCPQ